MKVSYIIPTYNRLEYLNEAINSCFKQNYNNFEIIVSDNSDNDLVKKLTDEFSDERIIYCRNSVNIGAVANWKKAIELSSGDICIILSDDDYFIDDQYTKNALEYFKDSSINLVICDCVLGKEKDVPTFLDLPLKINGREFIENFWTKNYFIPVISNFFRKSALESFEYFQDSDILYSDIELWLKMMIFGNVGYYNKPAVYYRFHKTNIVTNMNCEKLIKNSKFINNVVSYLPKKDGEVIKKHLFLNYLHFILNIYKYEYKEIKGLYFGIMKEIRIDNKFMKFYFKYIVNKIIRKIKRLFKSTITAFDK